jgi:hypothetical protein
MVEGKLTGIDTIRKHLSSAIFAFFARPKTSRNFIIRTVLGLHPVWMTPT